MILAIDCGSTNHKVALFDESLERRAVASTPVAYTVRDAERVEFDPERIWRETVSLIRQACVEAGIAPASITTISLASQAQTFTILDGAGHAVMPFISWMDKRAKAESAVLERRLGKNFHSHCSFPSPIPQLQLAKLLWLRRYHSGLVSTGSKIASLPGFLAWRLAGLHGADTNLAAMSGLFSLQENGWWGEAMDLCEVGREQMGDLVSIGQRLSAQRPCLDLDLSQQVQVVLAGNDQTAGAYANGTRDANLILTLGTALVVYRYAGEKPGPFASASCWGPYPGGGFYELAARDEGCAALDWAVEEITPGNEEEFFKQAASATPGAACFYPQFIHTDRSWVGSESIAARARAVLEGICFNARQLMEVDLKLNLNNGPIRVIGGGSRSDFWLQILANVLGRPLCRSSGDILLGVAMIASRVAQAPTGGIEPIFTPDSKLVELYEKVYRSWLERTPV
jgi:xylulokinase